MMLCRDGDVIRHISNQNNEHLKCSFLSDSDCTPITQWIYPCTRLLLFRYKNRRKVNKTKFHFNSNHRRWTHQHKNSLAQLHSFQSIDCQVHRLRGPYLRNEFQGGHCIQHPHHHPLYGKFYIRTLKIKI